MFAFREIACLFNRLICKTNDCLLFSSINKNIIFSFAAVAFNTSSPSLIADASSHLEMLETLFLYDKIAPPTPPTLSVTYAVFQHIDYTAVP